MEIEKNIQVSVIMGSQSDWPTMKNATIALEEFNIPYEVKIVSAHRTPNRLFEFGNEAKIRGLKVIIAGAGGAAHLPGMIASKTVIPVIGVPIKTEILNGVDSLYSIVQMPKGIPVATMAIGPSGAYNAGLFALSILGNEKQNILDALENKRKEIALSIPEKPTD